MAWIGAFEMNEVKKSKSASDHLFDARLYYEDGERKSGCFGKRKKHKKINKERIKQFSIWLDEVDTAKQKEFAQRRFLRQYQRLLRQRRVRCLRRLFVPTGLCWLVGFLIILASTIQRLGERTIFWTKREVFHVVGPVVLGTGFILLMVTEGLISNQQYQIKKLESLMMTPEVSIDVNGQEQNVKTSHEMPNSAQQTLKSISGKLTSIRNSEGGNEQFMEDHEPIVKPKKYPFRQKIVKQMATTEPYEQECDIEKTTQSLNFEELPLFATVRDFETSQSVE